MLSTSLSLSPRIVCNLFLISLFLFYFLSLVFSRIRELADLHTCSGDDVTELSPSDSEKLLTDCALDLEVLLKVPLHFRPFLILEYINVVTLSLLIFVGGSIMQSRVKQIVSECSDVSSLGVDDLGKSSYNIMYNHFKKI